ncbi:hypothetical protein TD95_003295 [Thielaviopsis punctulata]|uniref:Translation initiation factor IF-2, mitochondrial n=1 Tax=Thielaviopsis punctulata TaxID=72032 RepID=A0A0F4ZDN0_9PEZI|nr:hypothetical protein TD95_003295 [Thielaviopsis punctulata]
MEKLKKISERPEDPVPETKPSGFNIRKTPIDDDFTLPQQKAAQNKLSSASNRQASKPGFDEQSRISKFSNLLNNLSQQRQQSQPENSKRSSQGRQESGVWGSLMRKQGRDRDQERGPERGYEKGQDRGQDRGHNWVPRQVRSQGERYGDESRASRPEKFSEKPEGPEALGIEIEVDPSLTEEAPAQAVPESPHKKPTKNVEEQKGEEQTLRKYERSLRKDDKKKKRYDVDRDLDRKNTRSSRSRYEEDPDEAAWDAEDERMFEERRRRKAERKAEKEAAKRAAAEAEAAKTKTIYLPEFISVSALARPLTVKVDEFLEILLEYGFEDMTEDTIMTGETAALIAQEFGLEAIVDDGQARDVRPRPPPEDPSSLPQRPPVVTIMGHVDHGKTTLLDWLRKSSIAAQEHGGITQHIGAFVVKMQSGKQITFLDTPGHAAFLSMRKRGASATDIVVLVVAADDSVMPQTIEALKHAREAQVPIIVAITKCDKPEAQLDMVKNDLSRHGVEIEDYGGDVQVVPVSGKTGLGMDELEENIITLAEILDMRAETDGMSEGWVLEANIKPIGKAATILVKRGTLRIGDCIVAGRTWARVRALRDEFGEDISEAPPGTPVEVLGWKDLPQSGDQMIQAPDENTARNAVDYRVEMKEREESQTQLAQSERKKRELAEAEAAKKAAEEAGEEAAEQEKGPRTVNFIVRGDVVGSVEAVSSTILEIGNHEVQPRILRQAAGNITESDVEYAAASGSVIISFNNTSLGHIKRLAADQGVRIVEHSVIYTVADNVKAILSEKLDDKITFKVIGEAEVSKIFSINIKRRMYKNIAGCKVRNGVIKRNDIVRVIRKGEQIFQGAMSELKQVKRDVMEMRVGTECGISLDGFEDFEEGDIIQTCEEVRTKRSL